MWNKLMENIHFTFFSLRNFYLLHIFGEPLATHPNDDVDCTTFSTCFLVDWAGSLVGVMVAPECYVHLVLL